MAAMLGAFAMIAAVSCSDNEPEGPKDFDFPELVERSLGINGTDTFTVTSDNDFYISFTDGSDRSKTPTAFTMNEAGSNGSSITKDERYFAPGEHTFTIKADAQSYDVEYKCSVWMRKGSTSRQIRTVTLRKNDRTASVSFATLNDDGYWTTDENNATIFTPLGEGEPVELQFNRYNNQNTYMAQIKVETNVNSWSFTDNSPSWLTITDSGDIRSFGVNYANLTEEQLKNGVSGTVSIQDISAGNNQEVIASYEVKLPSANGINYAYFDSYGNAPMLIFTQGGMYDNGNTVVDDAQGTVVGFNTSTAIAADAELWGKDDIKTAVSPNGDNKLTANLTLSVAKNNGFNRTAYVLAFAGAAPANITPDEAKTKYADNVIAIISQKGPLGRSDGRHLIYLNEDDALAAGAKYEDIADDDPFAQTVKKALDKDDIEVYRLTYKNLNDPRSEYIMPVAYAAAFQVSVYDNFSVENQSFTEKASAAFGLESKLEPYEAQTSGYYCIDFKGRDYKEKTNGGVFVITTKSNGIDVPIIAIDVVFDPKADF